MNPTFTKLVGLHHDCRLLKEIGSTESLIRFRLESELYGVLTSINQIAVVQVRLFVGFNTAYGSQRFLFGVAGAGGSFWFTW